MSQENSEEEVVMVKSAEAEFVEFTENLQKLQLEFEESYVDSEDKETQRGLLEKYDNRVAAYRTETACKFQGERGKLVKELLREMKQSIMSKRDDRHRKSSKTESWKKHELAMGNYFKRAK